MLDKIPLISSLQKAYARWSEDDGSLMAAAVAYYAALSFFPLLLVIISGLGVVMQYTAWGQDAQGQVINTITEYASPEVGENVSTMLEQVQQRAAMGGPLGILTLILAAAAIFAQFENAFDRIWNVESPETKGILGTVKNIVFIRLRAFLMLLSIGLLVLIVFAAGMVLSSVKGATTGLLPYADWVWWAIEIGVSVTLNAGVFTLLYRFIPKVQVRWSEAFRGGLLTAVTWEIGRLVLASLVISDKYDAYGVVGSFIAVMLWMYFASMVIFLGAEYIQVIRNDSDGASADEDGPKVLQKSTAA